jgi:2-polyprenyl-6-methoxyphenol hydroxylase-like FAD-dependent oxidoreductase
MTVMVIGGGIGGLTAALSLHAAGIDVRVYESVADIKRFGVGINLQPNAVRELIELGVGDALAATAIETAELAYHNKHGQLIWSEPRGLAAGYAWPQYSIDRGDLQMILLDAVKDRIGPDNVFTGHHLVSFEQNGSGVTARFIDRRSRQPLPPQTGEVLVGCDGLRSATRTQLHPREGSPVWSGRIQWRGVVEAEPFLNGRTHATMGFSEQRAVVYPISRKVAESGRSRINWVTILGRQTASGEHTTWDRTTWERTTWERTTWDRGASKDRFVHHFKDWNFEWLKFADLICRTDEIYEYPVYDRDPLPRWSFGRVTLLGDAAHPMWAIGAQAGSQAIVDARVLARALATAPTPERALERYEAQRRPMMNAVTLQNRKFGPAIVMEIAEQRAPNGFKKIEDVMTRRELADISRDYKIAAGFDPEGLNNRPSLTVPRTAA